MRKAQESRYEVCRTSRNISLLTLPTNILTSIVPASEGEAGSGLFFHADQYAQSCLHMQRAGSK
jgi:hypothetical protein